MTLTAEERATYESRLSTAESAFHDLMVGGQARVFVDQNGERIEFTAANSARLRAYILELKSRLGKPLGLAGPMQPWVI